MPGAVEAINSLQKSYQIHFATTRLPKARMATIEWLDKSGMAKQRPYSLHFVGHREKHEVLSNFAAAIDDDLVQAKFFAAQGIRSLLIAHPWNTTTEGSIERIDSWSDIVERLNAQID